MATSMRSLMMAATLGLCVAGSFVPSTADAAPPPPGADEKAREALRKAREAARAAKDLDKKADDKRAAVNAAFTAGMKEVSSLDAQSAAKQAEADRWFKEAGKFASNEIKADVLRKKARGANTTAQTKQAEADRLGVLAETEKAHAKQKRDAAAAILANNPDPQMKADAAELIKQAEQDERDAANYLAQQAEAAKKAMEARNQAAAWLKEANRIDPDGT
jgi:hypothetical protein